MKWFKTVILIFVLGVAIWWGWSRVQTFNNPYAKNNDFYLRLENALSLASLKPFYFTYRDFISEVEFLLRIEGQDARIVLSTNKDAYSQVAALQNIIRAAKIKGKAINLIDLSIRQPYATLENN